MKIGAVVCEYNPFHLGHQYQLETARNQLELDGIIGIMSGNFVQRGDVSIYPKRLRAKAALSCGMDLVLELPAVLTLQSAERYAKNAVSTLNALGCIETLFFGAECPDTDLLMRIADVLANESASFKNQLKSALDSGVSFAAARAMAVKNIIGSASAEILSKPNNILAVEYCKALITTNSNIKPAAIMRKGAQHDSDISVDGFASASAIRDKIFNGQEYTELIPENSPEIYGQTKPFSIQSMEKSIISHICLMGPESLADILDVGEGLENAIYREAMRAESIHGLIDSVKSKRYAYSRIRRILICAYLGITHKDAQISPSYIRILDFNETGQCILNMAKKTATLPLAKNGAQIKDNPAAQKLWQRELAIDRIYQLYRE